MWWHCKSLARARERDRETFLLSERKPPQVSFKARISTRVSVTDFLDTVARASVLVFVAHVSGGATSANRINDSQANLAANAIDASKLGHAKTTARVDVSVKLKPWEQVTLLRSELATCDSRLLDRSVNTDAVARGGQHIGFGATP
jgi:hypothetical protein